jgi:hypothetical protein
MERLNYSDTGFNRLLLILACFIQCFFINAQSKIDTLQGRNIYRPKTLAKDTLSEPAVDELYRQYIKDSVFARSEFVRDSIVAREKFVQDSILKRQRILDSLNFLKAELPRLLDASLKIVAEEISLYTDKLTLIGDSTLSNYNWIILPISLDKPFLPWKPSINLSNKPIKIITDNTIHKISYIATPYINCSFIYGTNNKVLIINEEGSVLNNRFGKFYKSPSDSVFFDQNGRVSKIKRYIQLNQVINNFQKGVLVLAYLSQVKQYEYRLDNQITKYKVINFCDRWSGTDASKVCNIVNYSLTQNNNIYTLTRNNDPANDFSDGAFTFEFENNFSLKSVSFSNQSKSEDWKCIIELNEAGNVSRYVYQNKGAVHRTLLINYFLNDPKAKNKVETITCTFEDDGISYYQKNNTTGQIRIRDKETGEWSPWK